MARQPAREKVAKELCFRQHATGKGKKRKRKGSRKAGYVLKNGQCYQIRKYRQCGKKRAIAMYKGVAIVAPCGAAMTQALKDRAFDTYSDASWNACANRNKGVKSAKQAKCRIVYFGKRGSEPVMRGKSAGAKLKTQAKARWRKLSPTFKKKFAAGAYR